MKMSFGNAMLGMGVIALGMAYGTTFDGAMGALVAGVPALVGLVVMYTNISVNQLHPEGAKHGISNDMEL
jgi:hypothetical protein